MSKHNQQETKQNVIFNSNLINKKGLRNIFLITFWGCIWSGLTAMKAAAGVPNGTWLSQPQIRYHSSSNTLSQVMQDIYRQRYRVVFLDYRGVSDELQQRVSQEARAQNLIPVVWVQSPQYRSLTVEQLIYEARHGDAIQVDDHFFTHYSARQFRYLSYQYEKPIFCSIQPFQANAVSRGRCNQIDVQCYTSNNFGKCLALADRLNAVVSLFDKETFPLKKNLEKGQLNFS